MRKQTVFLCSLLSAASLTAQSAQEPAPVSIEAPVSLEPPAQPASIEEPAPITPPVPVSVPEDAGNAGDSATAPAPAVPGPIAPPVTSPAPAVPGTVVAPSAGEPVYAEAANSAHMVNEFQGEEIGAVLRLLARQASINLVVSDLIQGTVTMRLENLSPLAAIKVIVTAKGLIIDEIDNVYYIKTPAEKQREPTRSGHYTFSYASAEKIVPLLKSQIQSGIAPQFDPRTNTIYYRDFQSNIENVELFLDSVDQPTQQVMIEARLVEVNANPKQNYGINWAGVVGGDTTPQTVSYGGLRSASVDTETPGATGAVLGDLLFHGTGQQALRTLYGQFAILSAPQMSATLRLMNEDSDAEFLANPRVVTANNLEAKIEIIRNQPVPQLNFNEQTATAVFGGFEDKFYGNTLTVKPTINKDNFITMQVQPEISNKVRDEVFLLAGASVTSPVIDQRKLNSTVVIKSGDTLAIGGLLQDESSKARSKVPFLGDIPILGYVFQERQNDRTKRNLLVFVTPTIIKQGYGTGLEDQVSGLKHSGEEYADPNGWRNNARGAVRIVPTSNRQNVSDYPKPGVPPTPATLHSVQKPQRVPVVPGARGHR